MPHSGVYLQPFQGHFYDIFGLVLLSHVVLEKGLDLLFFSNATDGNDCLDDPLIVNWMELLKCVYMRHIPLPHRWYGIWV